MKKIFFSSFLICILPLLIRAQSQTSITIKTITIQNGDTVITERSYKSEGDHIYINDTLLNPKDYFIFFNKDYNLDTNFEENFNKIFGNEMRDFLKHFNQKKEEFFSEHYDLFNKEFPLDINIDTLFDKNDFNYQIIPDDKLRRANTSRNSSKYKYHLVETEIIINASNLPVPEFGIDNFSDDGALKIFFQLNEKIPTHLFLLNENQKIIYKEKIPKAKGLYTRLFDFNVYPKGTYFLKVKQGNKISLCKIKKYRN